MQLHVSLSPVISLNYFFYFDVFGLSYFQHYLIILNLSICMYVQTEIISKGILTVHVS